MKEDLKKFNQSYLQIGKEIRHHTIDNTKTLTEAFNNAYYEPLDRRNGTCCRFG